MLLQKNGPITTCAFKALEAWNNDQSDTSHYQGTTTYVTINTKQQSILVTIFIK